MIDAQVNHGTVGIEICQKADLSLSPVYTDAQVKSTAVLCAWLTEEFLPTTADITTHRQIITDGSLRTRANSLLKEPAAFGICFGRRKESRLNLNCRKKS